MSEEGGRPLGEDRAVGRLIVALLAILAGGCDFPIDDPEGVSDPSSPPTATTGEWPMYGQNPARTNFSAAETTIGVANVHALAPVWTANVGIGPLPTSSGPVVSGGRLFVGSSVTAGPNFMALDAASGRLLWGADLGHDFAGPESVGLGATAAVAGDLVVTGGGDSAYYALEAATGRILWRHSLDAGPSGFAWASPVLLAGRAYVGVASEFDNPAVRGEIRALDLATGIALLRFGFVPEGQRGAEIWNSVAATADGRTLFVATGEDSGRYDGPYNRAVVSLDAATFQVLQANKQGTAGLDQDFGTTPLLFRDRQGRSLVGSSNKNGVFYAYLGDAVGSGPVWSRGVGVSPGMMAAYDPDRGAGGTLFIAGDNGILYGVDPADGRDRFPPLAIGFTHANVALANGLLFANAGGRVYVVETATGRLLRVLEPAQVGPAYSGVIVANGRVYWTAGPLVHAWGLP
jgi:outer membrane protein assembly factor BamB